ncbi:hypothetical protein LCM19_09865 [Qipengyuania flava]|nr:hypothetical protein [Qipengyuania flava]
MKNVFSGRIVREDTRAGIPNLQVSIFDIDPALQNTVIVGDRTFSDIVARQADNSPESIRLALALIYGEAREEDGSLRGDAPAGDRLGSVLTGRDGSFELTFDDTLFHDDKKERRPDLLLAVLGPARTVSLDQQIGLGVPESRRVVHLGLFPRWNAGRQEAVYVTVPTDLFRLAGLDRAADENRDPASFLRGLADGAGARRREETEQARTNLFRWALPHGLAGAAGGLPPSAPREARVQKLRQTIANGVSRVAAIGIPDIRIALGPTEVEGLRSGTMSACDVISRTGGAGLARTRQLLDGYRARQAAEALDEPDSATDEGDPDPGTPPPGEEGADGEDHMTALLSRIRGQIEELAAPEAGKSHSVMDELQAIKTRINDLEMSGGPTNVAAFRDFHTLQVAFQDVWTAAFDREVESDVIELYRTLNEIEETAPGALPRPDDLQDLQEFEDFVLSLSETVGEEVGHIEPVPPRFRQWFTDEEWNRLTLSLRGEFTTFYDHILEEFIDERVRRVRIDGKAQQVKEASRRDPNPLGRLQRLILDLRSRLLEPYAFPHYAKGAVNYGLLVTYRQEWRPLTYQVGQLVSTIPLAPGETREFRVKRSSKLSRAEKEVRKALLETDLESSNSTRSELDVIAKLSTDTNFKLSANGSFTFGIGSIESASEFSHNQQTESSKQHMRIAEATRKASEKVRQEREIEVDTKSEFSIDEESVRKISNPNDEVTVTYLMYELERRFRVDQTLSQVRPVIMVAMDFPRVDELTEGMVLENAWIFRRVLLDAKFEPAISLIESGRSADAFEIAVLRATYDREQALLGSLTRDFDAIIQDRDRLRNQLIDFQLAKDNFEAGEESTESKVKDFFLSGGLSIFGMGDDGPDQSALYQAMIDEAGSRLKHVEARSEELATAQRAAKREARAAGERLGAAMKAQANKDTMVRELLLHIRQNIYHYMHAIWEMKHPDELFFAMSEMEVLHVPGGTVACDPVSVDDRPDLPPGMEEEGEIFRLDCDPPDAPALDDITPVRLGSIAHVDQLLGFRGNYAVFPLKECSHLTDYMMREYVDGYLGLRDPALDMGVSTGELMEYAAAVWNEEDTDREALGRAIASALTSPVQDSQEITLPTGQIYMEALKGDQTLLEDFKLAHRGLDVIKVSEEIRHARLENLRRAGRMLSDDPDFGDADIDRVISVRGDPDIVIDD